MFRLSTFLPKISFVLILVFCGFFSQEVSASVGYNYTVVKKIEQKRHSKIKKALVKKEKKYKKRHLERFSFSFINVISLFLGIGLLLFILGLIYALPILWIIGLSLFLLPIAVALVIGLILIIGLALHTGGLE